MNRVFRDIAHVGFYQGNMVELYISARGNGDGVYGIGSVQHEDGIQIKELVDPGKKTTKCGVSRELVPALNRIPAATSRLQSPACKEKS